MKSKKTPAPQKGKAAAKPAKKSIKTKAPAKPAKAAAKSAVKVKPKSKLEVKSKPEAVAKTKAKAVAKSAPKTVSKPKSKTVSKSKAKPEAKTAEKKIAAPKSKTPSRTLRPKTFDQAHATREFGFPVDAPELPSGYGRDRLVLMTQDPDYLFSYWEITPAQFAAKESEKRDNEQYREAIKLNWAARSLFEENFVLLPVSFDARRWYLRVPFAGLSYQVEIGWLSNRGHFISILESNESDSPESWDLTNRRLKDAGEVLAYAVRIAKPMGSSQMTTVDETIFTFKDWNPKSLTSSPAGSKSKKSKSSAR